MKRLACWGLGFSLLGFFISGCATTPPVVTAPPLDQPVAAATPSPTPALPDISLLAGGDVTPADGLDKYIQKYGADYPYLNIAPFFQEADIGLVNLECPISARGKKLKGKKFTFRDRPSAAGAISRAGIDVVSLANNHILDYGPVALEDTVLALDKAGVAHAGAGRNLSAAREPALITLDSGTTVAVLSYSMTFPAAYWATAKKPGTVCASVQRIQDDVNSACARAAIVVVCFHWGGELLSEPREYQTELGHAAIDAGARLVVGTHPHILQGVEWYQKGVILYSLGNLAFGGGHSRDAVQSALFKVIFSSTGEIRAVRALALSVDNDATHFQPTPLSGRPADAIRQLLSRISLSWGTHITLAENGWADILPPAQTP